ncbi:MAG: hypothetical protein LUM44_22950 [Pyrinomonadaceae bacterium]|nr:hypothetical protein [Pyrinomonadaceae bacterium]
MTIKDFGARVESVWQGLRPVTKKMIVGALQSGSAAIPTTPTQKFSYDTQSDWELSRLLTALDEQTREAQKNNDQEKLTELRKMTDTVIRVLQAQTESAEVFIQLGERLLKENDYAKFDLLSDALSERFSAAEIAEIIRQTDKPQIRAVAYETLSMLPTTALIPVLDDPLYADIALAALEQQAFEYESEDARNVLEQLEAEADER